MSDREGTPQDQNNGPIKEPPVPHSGQLPPHMREVPAGREFDKTPLDEAHRLDLIGTPSSTEQLGDLTEEELAAIRALREKHTKSGEHKGLKRGVVGVIGGAVLLGSAAFGVAKALGGSDGNHTADPNRPVATGPAVAGETPGVNTTKSPTQAPSSTETGPVDPEQRASEEAKQQQEKFLKDREPFYKNPITSLSLNGLLVDGKTRELLVPGLTQSEIVPGSDFFPNSSLLDRFTTNFDQVLARQQELSKAFTDGTIQKAIDQTNQLYGTNYKLEDFYISKDELPGDGASKAEKSEFLANKVVHVTQMFDALATTVRHSEPNTPEGSPEPLPSDKFIALSRMFESDQESARTSKDLMGVADVKDFEPGTVAPTSARLVTNAGGNETYNGLRLEQGNGKTDDVFAPVIGVVADVDYKFAHRLPGQASVYFDRQKEQRLSYYMLVPAEISGTVVDIPVFLGSKTLKLL